MNFRDEQNEGGMSTPVIYTIILVSALVLIVLLCVMLSNRKPAKKAIPYEPQQAEETVREEAAAETGSRDFETLYKEHKLRAEDLDFWDMYNDKDHFYAEETPGVEETPSPTPVPEEERELTDEEKAASGDYIRVAYKDGTEEWLKIDEKLPKNDFDYTKMRTVNQQMTYYEGNRKLSRLGVDISEDLGKVDFERLKSDGVDFCMIKVGSRRYGTGLITEDAWFEKNMEAAQKAGMDIGVYFCSQAVTVNEAVEEAKFVTDKLQAYKLTYPVALKMESVFRDSARTDILDARMRTENIEAFMNDIQAEGYQTILYGDTAWFLTEVLTRQVLEEFEVWMTDEKAFPDFPYEFKMWEYVTGASSPGTEHPVNYTISFVDYSKR